MNNHVPLKKHDNLGNIYVYIYIHTIFMFTANLRMEDTTSSMRVSTSMLYNV